MYYYSISPHIAESAVKCQLCTCTPGRLLCPTTLLQLWRHASTTWRLL